MLERIASIFQIPGLYIISAHTGASEIQRVTLGH